MNHIIKCGALPLSLQSLARCSRSLHTQKHSSQQTSSNLKRLPCKMPNAELIINITFSFDMLFSAAINHLQIQFAALEHDGRSDPFNGEEKKKKCSWSKWEKKKTTWRHLQLIAAKWYARIDRRSFAHILFTTYKWQSSAWMESIPLKNRLWRKIAVASYESEIDWFFIIYYDFSSL